MMSVEVIRKAINPTLIWMSVFWFIRVAEIETCNKKQTNQPKQQNQTPKKMKHTGIYKLFMKNHG